MTQHLTDRLEPMDDVKKIAEGHRYEPDERRLFCRHCGRAAWRHVRAHLQKEQG